MDGANQNAQAQQQQHAVTVAEFNAKYRSKQEVFRFLSFDCGAYLPSYQTVTSKSSFTTIFIYFFKSSTSVTLQQAGAR
jgi:hypothetical protein